jgi:hypothetical protein
LREATATKNRDEIIPYLEMHNSKMSGGKRLDRSIHEIKITPLKENASEPLESSLDEETFDYIWEGMVEFIRENKASSATKRPEFRLDIEW